MAQAKAAGKVNKVPLTDLFTKKQLPITLIIFLVCYSIFSVNWPVVGLLPLYLKENGYAENVKSLMFWAGFGILIGTLIAALSVINWVRRKPLYIAYCYHFSSSSQYSICQKIMY